MFPYSPHISMAFPQASVNTGSPQSHMILGTERLQRMPSGPRHVQSLSKLAHGHVQRQNSCANCNIKHIEHEVARNIQLHLPDICQHEVVWFDVSVQDPTVVQTGHNLKQLSSVVEQKWLVQMSAMCIS